MVDIFVPENYAYGKRNSYPHMRPEDVAIWERFIDTYPEAYDYCQYDLPVGDGPEFDTLVNPESGGHSERLYKKKIDVVGFKGESIDVIELKPTAGASAIGQVKNYVRLYKRDYTPPSAIRGIILTDAMAQDTREFARDEGVLVTIV